MATIRVVTMSVLSKNPSEIASDFGRESEMRERA